MNLQQLLAFREVMKTGSVSQAARNLHRTQPAVSASLKALEQDLGINLFLREGRRMIPVPEAHYLLAEASEVLNRLKTVEQNMTNLRKRAKGSLRIVAMPGPSSFLLPAFLSKFIENAPDIQISLAARGTPQVRNLIAAQSYDIGFCDYEAETSDNNLYKADPIHCDCLCALPISHPLASRCSITASDLDGMPLGLLQSDHFTVRETQRAFDSAGAKLNVRIDAQYFLPLFHFVESGKICAVVDVLSAASYQREKGDRAAIRFLPFTPSVRFSYAILTPQQRPLSLLAQDFVASWRAWIVDEIDARLEDSQF